MRKITDQKLKKFNSFLEEEEKSINTKAGYLRNVTMLKEWLQGRVITKSLMIEYKKLLREKYAPASVNASISAINKFFDFMRWRDISVKTIKMQKRMFTEKDKELTRCEYDRLLITAKGRKNKQLYYLLQTMCSTGIRVSELCYVTVETVEKGEVRINCKGKMRVVILPKNLCKVLKEYINERKISAGPVFVSKNGKPLDRSHIWKMLKSICVEAGVSKNKVYPHNLRHLFARTYYERERDIVRLADILGHSNINTTRIYTIETGETHRKQVEGLGLLNI